MRLTRTLAMTALLLAPAARTALAQEPPPVEPPPAIAPPPATAPPAAAAAGPMSTGGFGSLGQIAISVDLPFTNEAPQFAIVHESVSNGGSSSTTINIQPSLDYFVAPNVSVGGEIGIAHGSATTFGSTGGSYTNFLLEIRGGYNLALNDMFSIWPHLGIGYQHVSFSDGGGSGYVIPLVVTVPFLWHPASHFFLGLAPTLVTDLVSKFNSMDGQKTTDIGLTAVLGGYFGGT